MEQPKTPTKATKPEWAMSRKERERAALRAAGIAPRRFPILPVALVVILGGAAAVAVPQLAGALSPEETVTGEPEIAAPIEKQILALDVATLEPHVLTEQIKANGSLAPQQKLALSSQVSGTVESVPVRVGDAVRAGDLLVQVDVESSTIQLRQQKATAAATRAQLAQAESQLKRSEDLASRGITPDATVESERSNIDALRANLEALEAGVAAAELTIRNARIVAPFDGVVSARSVEPGQIVGAGAALVEIVDLSTMQMTAYVPVSASPRIAPGLAVELTIEGLSDESFTGRVTGISPVAADGTRTAPVEIVIANPDGLLRGGMFATGQIIIERKADALAVPAAALREDDAGSYVLAIAGDRLERRDIAVARSWNGGSQIEIASGLGVGTAYVSGRLDDLEPGMPVSVVEN